MRGRADASMVGGLLRRREVALSGGDSPLKMTSCHGALGVKPLLPGRNVGDYIKFGCTNGDHVVLVIGVTQE